MDIPLIVYVIVAVLIPPCLVLYGIIFGENENSIVKQMPLLFTYVFLLLICLIIIDYFDIQ